MITLDVNIVIATLLEEDFSSQARALIAEVNSRQETIVVPVLFKYELTSVIRKSIFRKIIASTTGEVYLANLLGLQTLDIVDRSALMRALEIANQFNLPRAYDAQYLAVAERYECVFWTGDEKLFNSVSPALPWVKWIMNFPLQPAQQ